MVLEETKAVHIQSKLKQWEEKTVLFLTNNDDSPGKEREEWEREESELI